MATAHTPFHLLPKIAFQPIQVPNFGEGKHFFDIINIVFCYFSNESVSNPFLLTASILFSFIESTFISTEGASAPMQESIFLLWIQTL